MSSKWISVEDKLPPSCELVLCRGKRGAYFLGYISYIDYNKVLEDAIKNKVLCMKQLGRIGIRKAVIWTALP